MKDLGLLTLGVVALVLFLTIVPVGLWIRAIASGAKVSIGRLIGMRFRMISPYKVVVPYIKAVKAGLNIKVSDLESHYLCGGDVEELVDVLVRCSKGNVEVKTSDLEAHALADGNITNVTDALIAAQRAKINISFDEAAAIDLAGRDVLEAVEMSVNPKVIKTNKVSAVAKDGIELLVVANVTVRADLDRLVGGAGEDTVLARIGEGIVTTVGSSVSHKEVLENPDTISKTVLAKQLDAGTAFEIVSIDIADIDIGRNIGAELQMKQSEADKNIAQAKAEERRAMAIAREQEMKAEVVQARADVVKAEAEVPRAMAEALRTGHLGIEKYYELKNIEADTDMRKAIADEEKSLEDVEITNDVNISLDGKCTDGE